MSETKDGFSPMGSSFSPLLAQIKPSSYSLNTPKRRLRLSIGDENTPGNGCITSTPGPLRAPLGEIQSNIPVSWDKTLPEKLADKENSFSTNYRPSSLPSLSNSDSSASHNPQTRKESRRNLYKQISSPMGRMSLMSPGDAPRLPSTSSSDGYPSEVFEGEDVEGMVSFAVSSLINAPLHPMSYHQGDDESFGQKRGSLKRSSPLSQVDAVHKRRCLPIFPDSPPSAQSHTLLRSLSIPVPSSPSSGEESFIGDTTKPYALPLVKGKSSDLKYISPFTLCGVLEGKFRGEVDCYTILDCRFPYEYDGGHIRNAKNIWTPEGLMECLFSKALEHPQDGHREIFIFHCEFSSKRGPNMSRFLRETDRKMNGMAMFPQLYYPELYLLDGGYNAFFTKHPEMCEPQSYCCMEDEDHLEELRKCKLRSKSWHGDNTTKKQVRRHRHSTQD